MFSKQGFTLIELLVVVLIIGILASVAWPQYKKAVFKSRAMKGYLWFNKLEDAQKLFYLANGRYAQSAEDLEFDFKTGTALEFSSAFSENISSIWDLRQNGLFWEFNFNRPNGEYVKFCEASQRSLNYEYGKQFCQEMGGVYSHTGGSGPQDYFLLPNR